MCGPPTQCDTFQVSHLWHVTLISWPIRDQLPSHVTRCQPIRGECVTPGPVHYQGSEVFDLWSGWQWYCVSIRDQGTGPTPTGGPGDLQWRLINFSFKSFFFQNNSIQKYHEVSKVAFAWSSNTIQTIITFQLKCWQFLENRCHSLGRSVRLGHTPTRCMTWCVNSSVVSQSEVSIGGTDQSEGG